MHFVTFRFRIETSFVRSFSHINLHSSPEYTLYAAVQLCVELFISLHCFSRKSNIPIRQSWMLHDSYILWEPAQYLPPFSGNGLSHVRLNSWIPPPQDRLHFPALHVSEWNLRAREYKKWSNEWMCKMLTTSIDSIRHRYARVLSLFQHNPASYTISRYHMLFYQPMAYCMYDMTHFPVGTAYNHMKSVISKFFLTFSPFIFKCKDHPLLHYFVMIMHHNRYGIQSQR